jgi:hypothetical protein
MHALLAMALAAQAAAAPGWETLSDPLLGAEVMRPAGWTVEALANDALVIRAPPPLQGSVLILPVSAPGASAKAVVATLVAQLGGTVRKDAPGKGVHAALVQFIDPVSPGVPRTALVAAALPEGRGLAAVLCAPSSEWDAARPALAAIAASAKLSAPRGSPASVAALALQRYEPFRESKEQAFSGELPAGWKKDLSVSIVTGQNPYVRAAAIGRSADNLYAFLHYKLASFQLPVAELGSAGAGFRPYQPGGEVLERFLFPAVAQRAPQDFSEWKITRRGGVQALFDHGTGVRFDGEEVEYRYRFKGEAFAGQAYVVTYFLPGTPTATWFLYGLFGFEAPFGREEPARAAALRLLRSFSFEGRYAAQSDLFWTLARDGALKALSVEPVAGGTVARRPGREPANAIEGAALSLVEIKEPASAKPIPVATGISNVAGASGESLGDLRELP